MGTGGEGSGVDFCLTFGIIVFVSTYLDLFFI